jgi:hypothetical protein
MKRTEHEDYPETRYTATPIELKAAMQDFIEAKIDYARVGFPEGKYNLELYASTKDASDRIISKAWPERIGVYLSKRDQEGGRMTLTCDPHKDNRVEYILPFSMESLNRHAEHPNPRILMLGLEDGLDLLLDTEHR